jgi:hypothetical protein
MGTVRIPDYPSGRITKAKYASWYREMAVRGLAYHPEDNAHEICNANGPTFSWEEAQSLNYFMESVDCYIKDPCAIAMKIHKELDSAR